MDKDSKIYIAGNTGMVGSAILRNLQKKGYNNFVFSPWPEYDLNNQAQTEAFFEKEKPEYVINAAAKVGGIVANNTYRAQFIYENLMMQNNIIHSAYKHDVKKLLFLGSSCIYPKEAPQPLKEEYLLSGPLENTNEPYALAKIAGIKMCENYFQQYGCNYISVMPTNLYGPNDNYDLEKSHVLPALIRKLHLGKCLENNDWDAIRKDLDKRPVEGITGKHNKEEILSVLKKFGIEYTDSNPLTSQPLNPSVIVSLWGTGQVYREFLYVDDMADAGIHIMENMDADNLYNKLEQTHINIGSGKDLTIKELSEIIKAIVNYKGQIYWDHSKPDGTIKKQLDVSLLNSIGWKAKISLVDGIKSVYQNYTI